MNMEKLEVSELLPRLSGTENDQVEALKELHRIAVWSRGSTLPRGDLTEAARTRRTVKARGTVYI